MYLEWILLALALLTGLGVLLGRLNRSPEGRSVFVDYGRSLFPVIIIVFALRSFIAEPFRIPSGSMLPTLHLGDFILVNKFAYGIKLPIVHQKIIPIGVPKRGDIAVFRYPGNEKINYIKRIVGLPGDKVETRNKQLFINGKLVQTELLDAAHTAKSPRKYSAERLSEQLGDVRHDILVRTNLQDRSTATTVPEGHYFVMGDNRDSSSDSRVWGFVPDKNLAGKAIFIWFSYDQVDGGLALGRVGRIGK